MVPTLTCGFVRSNFCFAIGGSWSPCCLVGPVDELGADVDDRVAREHTRVHRLRDAGVDRGDELLRDLAAGDLVGELVTGARLAGREVDDDVRVLARAAGLANEPLADVLDAS